KLPGLTAIQQPVANAIDTVCPNLAFVLNIIPDANGNGEQRLTHSCSVMVVTSFFLQGQVPPFDPNGTLDLRITNPQERQLLQDSGPVQHNAQNQISMTAARTNLLAARLFDLRAGARGLSTSMNGVDVPAFAGSQSGDDKLRGATGGAASADPAFGGRLGGFVKVGGNWGKVDETTLQDPYKYDSFSILGGVDYRVSDAFIVGGAVSYEDTRSRFDNSLGNVKAQTWSVAGYGTYTSGPWYVDGFVSYGTVDYDTNRTIFIPSNNPNIAPVTG